MSSPSSCPKVSRTYDALAQVSRDQTKLAKLLPLKSYAVEKKVALIDEFAGRYGWAQTATFVRALPPDAQMPICDEMLAAQVGPLVTVAFQDETNATPPIKVWISKDKNLSGNPITLHAPLCSKPALRVEGSGGHISTTVLDDPLANPKQQWLMLVRLEAAGPGRYLDRMSRLIWVNQGTTNRYIVAKDLCDLNAHGRIPSPDELRHAPAVLATLLNLPPGEMSFAWSNDGVMSILVRALATGEEKSVPHFDSAARSVLCVVSE
jgi:hypothetical protein